MVGCGLGYIFGDGEEEEEEEEEEEDDHGDTMGMARPRRIR